MVPNRAPTKEPFVPILVRLDYATWFAPEPAWKNEAIALQTNFELRRKSGVQMGEVLAFDRHDEFHPFQEPEP